MNSKNVRIKGPGGLIKHWREIRKISQINLAMAAGVSARHLSFVETGRSKPGRNTLLKIGRALKLTYRQQNLLFKIAGYNPFFSEPAYEDPEMAVVWDVVSQILNQHEPFPAYVVNGQYDILWSNHGMQRMVAAFAGKGTLEKYPNIYRLSFAQDGMRPYFIDWDKIESSIMNQLFEEAVTTQHDGLWALYNELSDQVEEVQEANSLLEMNIVVAPFTLENDEMSLNLFSTVTAFNTALSVTVEEMRIESIFPADEATRSTYLENFG